MTPSIVLISPSIRFDLGIESPVKNGTHILMANNISKHSYIILYIIIKIAIYFSWHPSVRATLI